MTEPAEVAEQVVIWSGHSPPLPEPATQLRWVKEDQLRLQEEETAGTTALSVAEALRPSLPTVEALEVTMAVIPPPTVSL